MQTVARIAFVVAHRAVLVSAFEINAVVALDAVKCQGGAGGSRQKQKRKDNMYKTFIHHGVLSS